MSVTVVFGLTNTTDFPRELARLSDADISDVKSGPPPRDGFESSAFEAVGKRVGLFGGSSTTTCCFAASGTDRMYN